MLLPSNPSFAEMKVLQEACAAFENSTRRFKAQPQWNSPAHPGPVADADASVQFDIAGARFSMPVQVKVRAGNPGSLLAQHRVYDRQPKGEPRPLLFVMPHVGAALADFLIEHDIPFLDTAGNAYLAEPEGRVMITGRGRPSHVVVVPGARSTTRTGIQVMFALATQPALVNMPFRVIAECSAVSLNSVKLVMDDLLARGLVAESRSGSRMLPDLRRFIAEWVSIYPSRLRPKLHGRRFASTSPDWWRNFDFAAFNALLGGEAAAELMTGHLKAASAVVYAQEAIKSEFMIRARLRADERGDVEILEAFWTPSPVRVWQEHKVELVHPLLIYADLIATGDSRNLAIAEEIYDSRLDQSHA